MCGLLWWHSKECISLEVRLNQFICPTLSVKHGHFSKDFGDSDFIVGFTVIFSLRDRKAPQPDGCWQLGQSSKCWVEAVDPGSILSCTVVERSYPLGHKQPEEVKNKPKLVRTWVKGKRLPLILAGSWLYSTDEICHAKHPQCCITDQMFSFQIPTA